MSRDDEGAEFANHPLFDRDFVSAIMGFDGTDASRAAAEYRRRGAPVALPFHPLIDPGSLPERLQDMLQAGDVGRVLEWLSTRSAGKRRWSALWDPRVIGAELIVTPEADGANQRNNEIAHAQAAYQRITALDPEAPLPGDDSGIPWGTMRSAMIAFARASASASASARGTQNPIAEALAPIRRDHDLVSLIVVDGREVPERVVRTVVAAMSSGTEHRLEVSVAVHPDRQLHGALHITARTALSGVSVIPAGVKRENPIREAVASAKGATVILIDADIALRDGVIDALSLCLLDPDIAAAQPTIVAPDGAIIAAGMELLPQTGQRVPFLEGLTVDDLTYAPAHSASALAPGVIAMRTDELARVLDSDDVQVGAPVSTTIASRVRAFGRLEIVHHEWAVLTGDVQARLFAATSSAPIEASAGPNRANVWADAGWMVTYVLPPTPPRSRVEPILLRPNGHPLRDAPRWSIKIGAAFSRSGDRWGDVPFAADLAAALRAEGCDAVVDRHHPGSRRPSYLDDVVLAIRGRHPIAPVPGRRNILWVISRPELIELDEFDGFDVIAAASAPWARWAAERSGRPVEVLLQAAAERFRPPHAPLGAGGSALFVGGAREPDGRRVVTDAAAAGIPLELWGPRWGSVGLAHSHAGDYLDNALLPQYYASAGVVLSDHLPEMAAHGFINNRVFEALAAGARVISDHVEGLDETFGSSVRTYDSLDELAGLFAEREAVFPSEEERRALAARVYDEHSFAARARALIAFAGIAGA